MILSESATKFSRYSNFSTCPGGEMVDALGSGPRGVYNTVEVRVLSWAQFVTL